jgi:hypothetical protein
MRFPAPTGGSWRRLGVDDDTVVVWEHNGKRLPRVKQESSSGIGVGLHHSHTSTSAQNGDKTTPTVLPNPLKCPRN